MQGLAVEARGDGAMSFEEIARREQVSLAMAFRIYRRGLSKLQRRHPELAVLLGTEEYRNPDDVEHILRRPKGTRGR